MIYAVVLYILFGIGFALGRRESGATIPGMILAGAFWPLWLGYTLGRINQEQDQ